MAAAAAAVEVQNLLRFLTQDAKVPLAAALPKIGNLRKANLNNPEKISRASQDDIKAIFSEEKVAKQVFNAAKRVANPKKRALADASSSLTGAKRAKGPGGGYTLSESDLQLPTSEKKAEELAVVTIETNRAPLVLAFAVMLLKHTMPEQPLSSRLSLAQAVVSLNSQSKAKSIGLISDKTAEDEGWAQGQPKLRVMGREVAVMRRAIKAPTQTQETDSQATMGEEGIQTTAHEAFWGLDLEVLRKSNGPLVAGRNASGRDLPIHTPQAARSYLLKSFNLYDPPSRTIESESGEIKQEKGQTKKKPTAAEIIVKKEEAAGLLLKALDILFGSWTSNMTADELDRKAWSWYMHVRPEVAQGQAGWGQRGQVNLGDILKFRKTT